MKRVRGVGLGLVVAAAVWSCGAGLAHAREKQVKGAAGEAAAPGAAGASLAGGAAGAGVSVRCVNGQTTVTYKGAEVFSGQTSGAVSARSSNVNGAEYAAAFDGDKVLWENVSGAAAQLKSAPQVEMPGLTLPGVERQKPAQKLKGAKRRRQEA